ncbi:hypothetical protein GQX74_010184 [Glossina fuscipes]|nr:hypothetical protein GQX74_010184 [Glossina fuscipes]
MHSNRDHTIDINDRSVAFAQKANETERHNKCFDDTISNETNRSAEGDGSPNIRKSPRQSVDDSGSSSNGKSPSIRFVWLSLQNFSSPKDVNIKAKVKINNLTENR